MELHGTRITLTSWQMADAPDLARRADDPRIGATLRDRFPSPYTLADAESWLAKASIDEPTMNLAIRRAGEIVGGIGVEVRTDVERFTGEVGYWLHPDCWGQGLASEALQLFVDHLFRSTPLVRIEALVFAGNPASERVLEKAGFVREGTRRWSIFKAGQFSDSHLFARLRDGR